MQMHAVSSKMLEKYHDMLHTFLCYKAPSVSTQMLVLKEVQ